MREKIISFVDKARQLLFSIADTIDVWIRYTAGRETIDALLYYNTLKSPRWQQQKPSL